MSVDSDAKTDSSLYISPIAERLSDTGCFEWEIRTNKVVWSDGLFRIYGLEPQQFDATLEAFLERVVPEDRLAVQTAIQEALETTGRFSCTERIIHASGEIRFLKSSGEVIKDANGEPIKLVGVCRDVSAEKTLENQLRNSQKMEAVGRLAAGVAHDFNNLLTVINMNADLLLSQSTGNLCRQFSTAIQDAAGRASNLTSQLLMFGQKGNANRKIINLNDHILDAHHLLTSLLGERVTLETDLVDEPTMIEVDKSHLDQVLVNLAVNAHDAMANGGTFTICTRVEQIPETSVESGEIGPGKYVVLVVSDTGKGMSSDECEKAFEPFFSDKPIGTGLGLAVVYGVVKDCNGMVQLSSEPGAGTKFQIFFPSAKQELAVSVEDGKDLQNVKVNGRILIVDDESMVRDVLRTALQLNGYFVLSAENGRDAFDLLIGENDQVDLLITDVVMPKMTGPELVEIISEKYPNLPVLYISGYNDSLTETIVQQQLLAKPFSIQQLLEKVQGVLNKSSSHSVGLAPY